jgi:hypothetical protein
MARPTYHVGVGTPQQVVLQLGPFALTAFAAIANFVKFPLVGKAQIIGMTLNVATRGGTHSASAVDVLVNGVSALVTPFDVDALTPGTPVDKEGTALSAAAANIPQGAIVSVSTTESGGSSPTWANATLTIDYMLF